MLLLFEHTSDVVKNSWGDSRNLALIYAGFAFASGGLLYAYTWWDVLCGRFFNDKISVNAYNNLLYTEEVKNWATDYDCENPATAKSGKKRFKKVKAQSKKADNETGMEKLVKAETGPGDFNSVPQEDQSIDALVQR
jgi:hypothetical protein